MIIVTQGKHCMMKLIIIAKASLVLRYNTRNDHLRALISWSIFVSDNNIIIVIMHEYPGSYMYIIPYPLNFRSQTVADL